MNLLLIKKLKRKIKTEKGKNDKPHRESSQYDHHEELPQDSQHCPQFSLVYSMEGNSRSKEAEFLQRSVYSLSPSEGRPASKENQMKLFASHNRQICSISNCWFTSNY